MPVIYVHVRFDEGVPSDAQAKALLSFEHDLRELTGLDCRVYKDRMADDSKLRRFMTKEEREKL